MFISLNKKIIYTICIFMILIFALFVATFYEVYGKKFIEDQQFIINSPLQISELNNNNILLAQELHNLKRQFPQAQISLKAQQVLQHIKIDTPDDENQAPTLANDWSAPYLEKYRSLSESLKIIGISLLIIAILIVALGSLIRRWLLAPIGRLSLVSDKVSAGDLSSRVPTETAPLFRDELSNLAQTFNQMLQNLNQNFDEIKRKEHFLQSLIDNIPDGIRVIDENYNIIIANQTYYKQTQHQAPHFPEKCYFSSQRLNHPCISASHSCPLREIKKKNLSSFKSIQRFSCDNSKHFSINAAPMKIELPHQKSQTYIVEAIRDLSNDIEFSHQQKLSSLGFLATSVAHEIKNHLGSIRMITEALLNKKGTKREQTETEYLKLINSQINDCINVPERLLSLSRDTASNNNITFNCAANIEEVIALLDYEVKRNGINVTFDNQAPQANLYGNSSDFKMALINLIQNSLKAMKPNDKLTLTLEQKRRNQIIIHIADTGCGIPKKDLVRIFEPFYTTQQGSSPAGTGLGLPIVKSIVEKFNGSIQVKSTLGQGSCFTLKFAPPQNNTKTRTAKK